MPALAPKWRDCQLRGGTNRRDPPGCDGPAIVDPAPHAAPIQTFQRVAVEPLLILGLERRGPPEFDERPFPQRQPPLKPEEFVGTLTTDHIFRLPVAILDEFIKAI